MNPDASVGLFTRIWDWLTYRPWTDEQLANRVARSVANTAYKPWHNQLMYVEIPIFVAKPGSFYWRDGETQFVRDNGVTKVQFGREETP
jgi:hypothetical protein